VLEHLFERGVLGKVHGDRLIQLPHDDLVPDPDDARRRKVGKMGVDRRAARPEQAIEHSFRRQVRRDNEQLRLSEGQSEVTEAEEGRAEPRLAITAAAEGGAQGRQAK
jgi:hypothetical protein